jgi:hypothetical protein
MKNDMSMLSKTTAISNMSKSISSTSMKWYNTSKTSLKFNSSKERKNYYDKLQKKVTNSSFKEREKEILAKIKSQSSNQIPKDKFKKNNISNNKTIEIDDETYFFNKERETLKARDKFFQRSLTPVAYHGHYYNNYKVTKNINLVSNIYR